MLFRILLGGLVGFSWLGMICGAPVDQTNNGRTSTHATPVLHLSPKDLLAFQENSVMSVEYQQPPLEDEDEDEEDEEDI